VELYASIKTLTGNIVREFEDVITQERKAGLNDGGIKRYQKTVALDPGLYKLTLIVKDLVSGRIGFQKQRLEVSRKSDRLWLSPPVLADLIVPVKNETLADPFVTPLDWKVYPAKGNLFLAGEQLGIYFEIYNFQVDSATSFPDLEIGASVKDEDGATRLEEPSQHTFSVLEDRLPVSLTFSLEKLDPGYYTVQVQVEDKLQGQRASESARFQVIAPN